jgi:peroxiredoxin
MRCHNIFLILLLFFYALSCGSSAETNQEKIRTVKKSNKPTTAASQKNSSKRNKATEKNQNSASQKIKAPDFNLADLDGNILNFSAYEGQVVMLTFWGTWCGPCRQEIPDFIELYDKYNKEGLEIVGIAIQSGSPENIKLFSENYKINYPILTDINGNESYKAFSDYGTISGVGMRAVPTTFLIDRDGYIVKTYRGARPGNVFLKDLKPYL